MKHFTSKNKNSVFKSRCGITGDKLFLNNSWDESQLFRDLNYTKEVYRSVNILCS